MIDRPLCPRIGARPPRPVRGYPGGWRDWWDFDDGSELAAARDQAARFDADVQQMAAVWRAEIAAEATTARRRHSARPGA